MNNDTKQFIEVVAKAGLSIIPVVGSPVIEIYDAIKEDSLRRWQNDWIEKVEKRLSYIEKDIAVLGGNEVFASTVIQATRAALQTSENEKREWLANAVCNTIDMPIEESVASIFVDLIGHYTVWHIKILMYFDNPKSYYNKGEVKYMLTSPFHFLILSFDECKSHEELFKKIVSDLQNDGMITQFDPFTMMSLDGALAKRTTQLGSQLLSFINNGEE